MFIILIGKGSYKYLCRSDSITFLKSPNFFCKTFSTFVVQPYALETNV